MKNSNPPPRRCYLSFYWKEHESTVNDTYARAETMIDVLMAAGWTEAHAKQEVENLFSTGRRQGYDDAIFDMND
jgi:hypothetical protein